jgi:hypothetical protein
MSRTRVHRTIKVQFDKGSSREETLLGRDYLVVPCVAMVEGVRFGANQDGPELGLASEFGETPIVWSHRPLVLDHPQVDGEFVSANTPDILNKYQFGLTMNPTVEDGKLKMEAWIDLDRVNELGEDFEDIVQRIEDEEDVEVSVGFFSDLEKKKGKFKGQTYQAIWRNIRPDHLAVLSSGKTGACSVKDGCGIPRLNVKDATMPKVLKTSAPTTTQSGCSCGGAHTQEDHVDEDAPVTQKGLAKIIGDLLKPFTQSKEDKALEAHQAQRALNEVIVNQSIDASLMDRDVRQMISRALSKVGGSNYVYLLGYTSDKAIYEDYDSSSGAFLTYQIGINVSDSAVEFVGEPEEVLLQTKIVPQSTSQENDMTQQQQPNQPAQPNPAPQQPQPAPEPSQPTPAPVPSQPAAQSAKVLTAQEYVDQAPPEVRDFLASALKAQEDKKAALVKVLSEFPQNKFSADYLKAQSNEILENMVALLPGKYAGIAVPANPQVQNKGEGDYIPSPKVFAPKVVDNGGKAA